MKSASILESREKYSMYINEHIQNVRLAASKYLDDLCRELDINPVILMENISKHDQSKYSEKEFEGYRQFFYTADDEEKNEDLFNIAWLRHQNRNPHHPEYWVMRDDLNDPKILDMPDIYIAEMLLDWASMSIKFGGSAFTYYERDGHKKCFSANTRRKVEKVIHIMK